MKFPFKRALVTGGAGFIGSHLVTALAANGVDIRVVDNLSTGKRENLPAGHKLIHLIVGDICDSSLIAKAMEGVDIVFHLAAVVSVPESVAAPVRTAQVNEIGTLGILSAALNANVRRLIFSSSSAVYGNVSELPVTESVRLRPVSPYAVQKWAGEIYCQLFASQFGLETVCLRYFNVFGPRQDPSSPYSGVISRFMDCVVNQKVPVIYGNGNQTRDFVFVDDVVAANLLAASGSVTDGDAMNVGTGCSTSIRQLWDTVAQKASSELKPDLQPPRVGDILNSVASIQKASQLIDFSPAVAFDTAIDQTLRWYRDNA